MCQDVLLQMFTLMLGARFATAQLCCCTKPASVMIHLLCLL